MLVVEASWSSRLYRRSVRNTLVDRQVTSDDEERQTKLMNRTKRFQAVQQ